MPEGRTRTPLPPGSIASEGGSHPPVAAGGISASWVDIHFARALQRGPPGRRRPTIPRGFAIDEPGAALSAPLRADPEGADLGGRRLETVLHKPLGSGTRYAESWEVADHRDDVSRVADGPLAGASLRDLVRERGEELLGPALGSSRSVPAPGQIPRRASGPLRAGPPRRHARAPAGGRQRQDRGLGGRPRRAGEP